RHAQAGTGAGARTTSGSQRGARRSPAQLAIGARGLPDERRARDHPGGAGGHRQEMDAPVRPMDRMAGAGPLDATANDPTVRLDGSTGDDAMKAVVDIAIWFNRFAPNSLAESWDNVGLLWGDPAALVEKVMTCLTVTPATVAEAIADGAGLVVSHHPVLFKP